MIFLVYNLFKKNYLYSSLLTIILLIIKSQNLLIVYFLFFINILFDDKNERTKYVWALLIILIILAVFNLDFIFEKINAVSFGFYAEEFGGYKSKYIIENFTKLNINNLFPIITKGVIKIFLSPFPNLDSIPKTLIFFENIVIYITLYYNLFYQFSKKSKSEKKIAMYWLFTLIFSFVLYSLISFNDGTIHRYKIILLSFVLISCNIHLNVKKNNIL